MMKFRRCALSVLITWTMAVSSAVASDSIPRSSLIALQNVTVIDGNGNPPVTKRTILIEGDRIKAIFRAGSRALPKLTTRVDLQGMYVLPGLIDAHVHLATDPEHGDSLSQVLPRLGQYLRGGVTAVRDMGGDARVLGYLSRQTLIDEIVGPDIFYAAIIGGPEFFSDPRTVSSAKGVAAGSAPWMRAVTNNSDFSAVIGEAKGSGATGIKIYRHVSSELLAPLASEAARQTVMSWAHLDVFPAPPQSVADAAVNVVSHAAYFLGRGRPLQEQWEKEILYSSEQVETVQAKQLIQTLADNDVLLDATLTIFDRAAKRTQAPYYVNVDRAGIDFTRAAHRAGIAIVAGTDQAISADDPMPPVHDEMALLVERAGLAPVEAIQAATFNGARALGKSDDFGSIAEGLKANLLVLGSDPLADIRNTRDIKHVIKNGRFVYRGFEGLNLPFSDARVLDGQLWLSGQLGNLPGTLSLVAGGIVAETAQTLRNIDSVLQMHGLTRDAIRKCTVMLADISEWRAANEVYAAYFNREPMPARSAFGASGLALGARIELECVAQL
ncbi:MAG: amidohydrolase family protein [Pseudomonadota bacterium]